MRSAPPATTRPTYPDEPEGAAAFPQAFRLRKDEGGGCGFRLLPFRSDVICGPSRQLQRLSP
jgi:hypothetical protein